MERALFLQAIPYPKDHDYMLLSNEKGAVVRQPQVFNLAYTITLLLKNPGAGEMAHYLKNTGCSSRGAEFNSQLPHISSQPQRNSTRARAK